MFINFKRPGDSQNRAKIAKFRKTTPKNRSWKNTRFSTPFFLDFSSFWPLKTIPKSRIFRCFFENVGFVKIVVFLKENCYFEGFEPPKIDPKSMQNRTRKKHRKKPPKNRSWPLFWPPETSQNPSKSLRKATLSEACFATLCKSPTNRRKATGVIVCKASIWLRIWLGLLHPSIHPSIHWDSLGRPNHCL